MRNLRGGTARSSEEVPDKGMERRCCVREPNSMSQPAMGGADEEGKAAPHFRKRCGGGFPDGSCMSREAHVQFCERLCQEDEKSSCCTKDGGRPSEAGL